VIQSREDDLSLRYRVVMRCCVGGKAAMSAPVTVFPADSPDNDNKMTPSTTTSTPSLHVDSTYPSRSDYHIHPSSSLQFFQNGRSLLLHRECPLQGAP